VVSGLCCVVCVCVAASRDCLGVGRPKPQVTKGRSFGSGGPRAAPRWMPRLRSSAVTRPLGCFVDGMGQIYHNNTTSGARQGPHGVAPELLLLFGPQGVLARGAWWSRCGGLGFLQGGPGFGGRAGNKTNLVILRLKAASDLQEGEERGSGGGGGVGGSDKGKKWGRKHCGKQAGCAGGPLRTTAGSGS
jgi:hypothetical protein